MIERFVPDHTETSEDRADRLRARGKGYPVEVKPPRDSSPPVLENFVRGVTELQTRLLKLDNVSPTVAYEIRRSRLGQLRLQYVAPTKRLERKSRTQLSNQVSETGFEEGVHGVPISPGESVGGGFLTLGRKDWVPLRTEFNSPPLNSVVASLHRHAMQDTKFVIQILFKPVVGRSVKQWWQRKQAYQTTRFLRKEKERLWGSRSPTPRERQRADLIEQKMGSRRFHTSVRIVVIGAGDYTLSRLKEVAGGFNVFESSETGQYLDTEPVRSVRKRLFHGFLEEVADRRFGNSLHFETFIQELAGLVSVPDRSQENINNAL